MRGRDTGRLVALVLTGVILVVGAWEFAFLWPYIDSQHAIGTDLAFYRAIGERWLDTGQFYLPHQLAGPYTIATDVDVLYPPIAIPLMVALRWLPFPLWWLIPLGVIGVVMVRLRPALWTWPLLAFCLVWPRNLSDLIYGNSNMWVIAAVAGGILWGWPAVFVALKPSLGPFALVGIRRRSWWIAAVGIGVASLFVLSLWRDYFTAIGNSDAEWYWSLEDVVPMSAPLIAWLGRRNGGFASLRDLVRWRPAIHGGGVGGQLPGLGRRDGSIG
jgi:hypothetical protein